jgi:hypothetical protein
MTAYLTIILCTPVISQPGNPRRHTAAPLDSNITESQTVAAALSESVGVVGIAFIHKVNVML